MRDLRQLLAVLFLLIVRSRSEIIEIDGDLKITVILNGDDGTNCSSASPLHRTQIASAIWTIERINQLRLLGDLSVGLRLYDSCYDHLKVYLETYLEGIDNERNNSLQIPVIVSQEIQEELDPLAQWLHQPILKIQEDLQRSSNELSELVLKFLIKMDFDEKIVLITDSPEVKALFLQSTCIERILKPTDFFDTFSASIIVYLGNGRSFDRLIQKTPETNKTWIVALDDGDIITEDFPDETFLILPSYADYYQTQKIYNKLPTSLVLFNVASPILIVVHHLVATLQTYCPENKTLHCLRSHYNTNASNEKIDSVKILQDLQISQLSNRFSWHAFRLEGPENNETIDFYFTANKKVDQIDSFMDHDLNASTKELKKCEVLIEPTSKFLVTIVVIRWRGEAWTAALISLTTIGFFVTFSVLIFFVIRICKGDILEGNPTGSIILVVTLLVLYLSVVPLCLKLDKTQIESRNYEDFQKFLKGHYQELNREFYESNDLSLLTESGFKVILWDFRDGLESLPCLVCTVTYLVISLSFTVAFGLILSRGIMIASIGYDDAGFTRISHVCGFIQASLFFFIVLVQCGLNLEIIWHRNKCDDLLLGANFVYLLGYNGFLLVVLVGVSPLIIRSQRNYNEGTMFATAIYFLVGIWSGWIGLLVMTSIGIEWKMVLLAFVTVASATTILCTVFIPRTYLIMTGLARDNLASSLQALNNYSTTNQLGYVDHQHHTYTFYDTVPVDKMHTTKAKGYNREEHFIPEPPLHTGYTNRNFQPDEENLCSQKIADKHFSDDYNQWCPENDDDDDDKSIDSDKLTRF